MSGPFRMTFKEWQEAAQGYYEGVDLSEVPWNRVIAFRCRKLGEVALGSNGEDLPPATIDEAPESHYGLFILRPRRKVLVEDVLFRATGKTRPPKEGEWLEREGKFHLAVGPFLTPYPIYERIVTPREIEVDDE